MKGTDPDDTLVQSGPEGVRAHFDGLRGEAIPPLGGRKRNGDGRHGDQAPKEDHSGQFDRNESKRAKGNGNGAEVRPFISTRAHHDTAELFLESLATPLWRHRGDFYEWSGPSWPKVDEDKLRAQLYPFLDGCQTKGKDGKPYPVKPNAPTVSGVPMRCVHEHIWTPRSNRPLGLMMGQNGLPHRRSSPARMVCCTYRHGSFFRTRPHSST